MESKTKTGAPWYCYCMRSATTATTTPSLADAAFLLLPLLLVLVLLGCCFVCTPWPANKDCGPVVVVTGWVSTTKGKNEKTQKYTSSGTGCQLRLQASQTKQSLVCYCVLDLQTKTAAPCVVPRPPPHNNPYLQTKTAAPCVVPRPPPTTTATYKQRLQPHALFQGPSPQQPPPANKDCGPVCCSKAPLPRQPPPANKDCGPVCCSKAPPHNNLLVVVELLNGSYKQRLEPRVLFLPCTASEITTTTPTDSSSCCCSCCHYY